MKGVMVIIDGIADEPCLTLGQQTPLQAADTPNLDSIATHSEIHHCYTVKKDYIPSSDSAIVSLLGYDFVFESRGQLEAEGIGIKLKNGDLALRCNFATIDDLQKRNVLDRRAGRTLTSNESRELAQTININVKLLYPFTFYPAVQHRGVLVIRGGFSDNISDVDVNNNRLIFSEPKDDEDESKFTAELINNFVRQSFEVLDKHPINITRAKRGLHSANIILCRGAGSGPTFFKKLPGKWAALAYMPLEIGIAKAAGMDVYSFPYPDLKNNNIYLNLYEGLNRAIKNAVEVLKKDSEKYDYFFIHFKETDLPGHDGKAEDKKKMIEILDKDFFSFLKDFIKDKKLIITGDHMTSCLRKAHTAGLVPLLIYPNKKNKANKKRFTEEEGSRGKILLGKDILTNYLIY